MLLVISWVDDKYILLYGIRANPDIVRICRNKQEIHDPMSSDTVDSNSKYHLRRLCDK